MMNNPVDAGFYQIPKNPKLVRERSSKALLSVDKQGLQKALSERATADKLTFMFEELNKVRIELSVLKRQIQQLTFEQRK